MLLACQCDDARLDHDLVAEVRVLDAAEPARTARDAIPTYSERAGALLRRVPDTAEVFVSGRNRLTPPDCLPIVPRRPGTGCSGVGTRGQRQR